MIQQRWTRLAAALAMIACAGQASAQLARVIYSENFDSLLGSLGPSVNERLGTVISTRLATDADSTPVPGVFSATGPAGWVVDNNLGTFGGVPTIGNTGVPGAGDPAVGVDEWEGWSFVDKDFWAEAAGGQDRQDFTSATGTVAVVDPDEYFDLEAGPSELGYYNSGLRTPSVPLSTFGFGAGEIVGVEVSFDSSWRDEAFDDGHPDAGIDNLNNQAVEVLAVFDTGETVVVDTWNSDGADAAFKDDTPNETVMATVSPTNTAATSVHFEFNIANAGNDWWWAIDNVSVAEVDSQTFLPGAPVFTEDFEGVALGDSVNERAAFAKTTTANDTPDTQGRPDSFTHTAPAGWTRSVDGPAPATPAGVDDNDGVFEWEGWSFATPEFWTFADTQGRENFTLGTGVVAIADGDEWDDLGAADDNGDLDTLIESPVIDLPALADGETLQLEFDSSWRDEDSQTAIVTVDYGSGPVEVLRWESDPNSAFFKDDNVNESVMVELDPTGPTAQIAFRYIGTNDWWWAVDNIKLGVVPEPSSALLVAAAAVCGLRRRG